jgi:hypothetical protein
MKAGKPSTTTLDIYVTLEYSGVSYSLRVSYSVLTKTQYLRYERKGLSAVLLNGKPSELVSRNIKSLAIDEWLCKNRPLWLVLFAGNEENLPLFRELQHLTVVVMTPSH